jgi:hypothetical protein
MARISALMLATVSSPSWWTCSGVYSVVVKPRSAQA